MRPVRTYVALLRGINVGGNNIIPMSELSRTFEKMRLASVKTYIQSGNVLFQSEDEDARDLERRIERALTKAHRYEAKVVLRTKLEMAAVIEGMPRGWKRPDESTRYNVVFLRHEIDSESVLDGLAPTKQIEQVSYRPGVLYWSAKASDAPRTAMAKLSSHEIYPHVTVRNLNTTRKLHELMLAMP
jgi:uncharacterized protein (DUF1697 family)